MSFCRFWVIETFHINSYVLQWVRFLFFSHRHYMPSVGNWILANKLKKYSWFFGIVLCQMAVIMMQRQSSSFLDVNRDLHSKHKFYCIEILIQKEKSFWGHFGKYWRQTIVWQKQSKHTQIHLWPKFINKNRALFFEKLYPQHKNCRIFSNN